MSAEIEAIVAADGDAQREIDAVKARLAERLRAQQAYLDEVQARARSAQTVRLEAEAAALERDGQIRIANRRAARIALRQQRRSLADAAVATAVAAYVTIVGGEPR